MNLSLEEIIKRCEGMYQISQINPSHEQIQAYRFVISSFLDICLLFEDIPIDKYTLIYEYYEDKLNGKEREPSLCEYNMNKVKLVIVEEHNNNNEMKIP